PTRRSSDLFHILLGGLDEQFPVGILAHVLSEEIKALLHVRGDCLRGRKFQPPFVQKLLYEGLNFSFQQFFGSTGDDKVICVADEIHTGTFSSQGGETPLCRKLLLQEPLQSIQRTIRSEEHTSELQSRFDLVCRLLLEKKKKKK